jgi:hypothetical protein
MGTVASARRRRWWCQRAGEEEKGRLRARDERDGGGGHADDMVGTEAEASGQEAAEEMAGAAPWDRPTARR